MIVHTFAKFVVHNSSKISNFYYASSFWFIIAFWLFHLKVSIFVRRRHEVIYPNIAFQTFDVRYTNL